MNVETVREYCLNKKGVTESCQGDEQNVCSHRFGRSQSHRIEM